MKILETINGNKLLALILAITILKGSIWAFITPAFQAPDEQFHYASVQHYAEPKDYKPRSYDFPIEKADIYDFSTQNFSPELKNFLVKTKFAETRFDPNAKYSFKSGSENGEYEPQIRSSAILRFVEKYPAWVTGYSPVYYKTAGFLENIFADKSVIERAYTIRIYSSLIGTLMIIFSYFIFRELFFNKTESALLAGILSFHPMLTFINSSVNIDVVLFLSFSIFLLGAIKMLRGRNISASLILITTGLVLGINAKSVGIFMLATLIALAAIYTSLRGKKIMARLGRLKVLKISLAAIFFASSAFFIYSKLAAFLPSFHNFQDLSLLLKYIERQIQPQILLNNSLTYWGNFGWLNVPISKFYIFAIWVVLWLAFIGIIKYFAAAKKRWKNFNDKEKIKFCQIIFLVLMVAGINLSIHFINFQQSASSNFENPQASIGTQGRYFFPVIIAKFALIAFGLSYLFKRIKRKKILFCLLIATIAFNMAAVFNFIIPRYYL